MVRYINSKFISFASISINKGALASAFSIEKSLLLGIVAVSILFAVLRFNSIPVGSFFDDAHYIILAESLFTGQGYHLINYPMPVAESAFPPGWPLLLAPVVGLFPGNLFLPKVLAFIFWLAAIPLSFKLFKKRLPTYLNIGCVALVSINPFLVGMAGTAMSESAFLFFSLLTLNLFDTWHKNQQRHKVWLLAVIFVCAFATLTIRTVGIALLAAILIFLLFTINWRYLSIAGGVILATVLPIIWFRNQIDGLIIFSADYNNHLNYALSHISNYVQIWNHLPTINFELVAAVVIPIFDLNIVATIISPQAIYWVSVALLAFIFLGFAITLPKYNVSEIYVFLLLGIFYIWTIYINTVQQRQLLPLLPFLYFYLAQAIYWLTHRIIGDQKLATKLTIGLLSVIAFVSIGRNIQSMYDPVRDRIVDLSIGTTWLRENSPLDAIVMATNATPSYLYARRKTLYPPNSDNLDDYFQYHSVDYVLVQPNISNGNVFSNQLDGYTTSTLLPYLESNPSKFYLVYENSPNKVKIFEVQNDE